MTAFPQSCFLTLTLSPEIQLTDRLVLRNYEALPYSTGGSDLDLLVSPGQAQDHLRLIERAAREAGGEVIGVARSESFAKACVFGKDHTQNAWWGVCVDLFDGLSFRGAELLNSPALFKIAETHNGVPVLESRIADLIVVLKELLNNGVVPLQHAKGAAECFHELPSVVDTILHPMGEDSVGILRAICLAPEDVISQRVALLRRTLSRSALRRAPFSFFFRRASFYAWRLRRLVSPPGLVVAVLGTDGAGKSTIIDAIKPVLEEATHAKVPTRHLRPMFLPPLSALRKSGQTGAPPQPVTDPHGSKAAGLIGSIIRLIWLWVDYTAGYWAVVRPQIAKTPTVFLFDRYADDLALDPKRFRIGTGHRLARIVPYLVPRPDLVIALYTTPEAIHARKPELPLAEVRRQVMALKSWATSRPECVLVDTGGSIEDARDEVLGAILRGVKKRR